jgi:crossover junction endodeoxyribonuclease RuvC
VRVVGVDPGLRVTGYGVIDAHGANVRLVEAGVLRPKPNAPLEVRLAQLHEAMLEVVRATRPDCMVVEELWSAPRHPPTAVLMGHARGVIVLAAGRCEVAFAELPHAAVKRALTGHGGARKAQVKAMVCVRLGLSVSPEPDDVSDALALAIVYSSRVGTVMDRAPKDRDVDSMLLRGRTGGPTLRLGGAQPGAERRLDV